MLEFQIIVLIVLAVLLVVGVVSVVFAVERKAHREEFSDWYDTPANDEDIALLGVVAPQKKKGGK
jgi:hypothetical protein